MSHRAFKITTRTLGSSVLYTSISTPREATIGSSPSATQCHQPLNFLHKTVIQVSRVRAIRVTGGIAFSKGICISPNVSLGAIKAVSNSSAENSTCIFNRRLKTCKKLSIEANSHVERRFHLGHCAGSEGIPTSGVTIVLLPPLHCSFTC
uniref:Uncharacterized protein n=1 Tax=Rhizophora mucronata TaxID=61149 RepID=A0A2P2LR16_RHIMU